MRVHHLNYCRQMAMEFGDLLARPGFSGDAALLRHLIESAASAQKFLLPDGGRLVEDRELRALDSDQHLRLPYPVIALEWHVTGVAEAGKTTCPKRIVFAREEDEHIVCNPVVWVESQAFWCPLFAFRLPMRNAFGGVRNGRRELNLEVEPRARGLINDVIDEASALVSLLNALACSNVNVERSEPKSAGKKAAMPFDAYHVLTISSAHADGLNAGPHSHRSPREHLRRGHIRRLADGRRVWVNAAVVAAGNGAGQVTKDYLLRGAA